MALRVGLRKTSLVDYPGRVAAVLFFPLCNLRCPWCHNPELVLPPVPGDGADGLVDLETAFSLVESRRNVLGGVVLTGGEPTLRSELPEIISRFKATLIAVKLDTNGTRPQALANLLADESTKPDYIALDHKLAPARYGELISRQNEEGEQEGDLGAAIMKSAALLCSSGIEHEFRSLALGEDCFTEADIASLAPLVDDAPWYFAPFRPGNCLSESWNARPPILLDDAKRLAALACAYGKAGKVRSG